jgi:multisubunit Na+/H+ antiporter MnhC subunit
MNIDYIVCVIVFGIGLYAVMVKKNLIKIVIGLSLMEYSVQYFLIATGYITGGSPPIVVLPDVVPETVVMVDPLPQALVLTSIVIGLSVTALALSIAIVLYRHYGTLDIDEIRGLKE